MMETDWLGAIKMVIGIEDCFATDGFIVDKIRSLLIKDELFSRNSEKGANTSGGAGWVVRIGRGATLGERRSFLVIWASWRGDDRRGGCTAGAATRQGSTGRRQSGEGEYPARPG
ncbi:hypothetical protein M0R45_016281 [Rubus argutus]|uniref:Uncharacterized protein n=1 Tax=Rubus argutus TaxID=59490 RepID=A0AAW1XS36_RUBAR